MRDPIEDKILAFVAKNPNGVTINHVSKKTGISYGTVYAKCILLISMKELREERSTTALKKIRRRIYPLKSKKS